jgi:hypothetical protein
MSDEVYKFAVPGDGDGVGVFWMLCGGFVADARSPARAFGLLWLAALVVVLLVLLVLLAVVIKITGHIPIHSSLAEAVVGVVIGVFVIP